MSEIRFETVAPQDGPSALPRRRALHYGPPMKPAAPVLAVVLAAVLPAAAAAQLRPPASPSGGVPGQVIVQFKTGVSASARGTVRGDADVDVVRSMRQEGQQLLEVQPGQTVAGAIRELETDPRVLYAQPNHVYHATAVPNDAAFGQLWGLRNLGQTVNGTAGVPGADTHATVAWDRTIGSRSIVVAVADTGIAYDHPDLAANIWNNPADPPDGADNDGNSKVDDFRGWDFCGAPVGMNPCAGPQSNDPRDLNEHGTHVAGTIGAVGNNVDGVAGMNWQVTLMPLRVLNIRGSGTSAAIADGFDYAGDHDAKVVNASLGGSGDSDPAEQAAIAAHPNTLYVVAAGNDGTNNDGGFPHVPCNLTAPNLVCVAATTQSDGLASFSNRGTTSVDLGAPGTDILSTVPSLDPLHFQDDFETNLSKWTAQSPWDRTTTASAGGLFSLTDSPAGTYVANADTSVRTTSTVPMGQGCRINYKLRLETESDFDFLTIETSPNATSWTVQQSWSGSTGGQFFALSTFLPPTTPQFVRFRLTSDNTVQFDGAYVDDVNVRCVDTTYDGTEYEFLDGTSMATPQVTGAAALALSLKPTTTVGELKSALLSSGDAIQALNGATVSGRRLNVANLLNTISPPPPTTPPITPPPTVPPTPAPKTLASVRVDRCKQSGRGKTLRLKCRLRDSDALRSSTAKIKKGRRTVATGKAKLSKGALSVKLKRKLRKGRYTLSLALRGSGSTKRTLNVKFRI
jgi:subtilisin family serine protease